MGVSSGKVAFFDSGIGGLTTLAACIDFAKENLHLRQMPQFFYYGDNPRAPYGNLPLEKINAYVKEAFLLFSELKIDAAVLACNTVTALCVERLRKEYPFPIIGTEPAVFSAAREGGEVFVLATRATYQSRRFQNLCTLAEKKYPQAIVRAFPCDELAGAIENHLLDKAFDFTAHFPRGKPSSVVLGCTHYVYIKDRIRDFYNAPTFDGNDGVARRLFSVLSKNEEKKTGSEKFLEKNEFLRPLVTPAQKSEKNSEIFFVGGGKMVNKTKYEQMFVLK